MLLSLNKKQKREFIGIIIFAIINTFLAFAITSALGIQNIVIYNSFSLLYGAITWEVIIFIAFSFIEAVIYEGV